MKKIIYFFKNTKVMTIAMMAVMMAGAFTFCSCEKAIEDIVKTVDNSENASDLETYWEGNAVCGETVMMLYLKFEVTAFGTGEGREIYKKKGDSNIYSDRNFTFTVNEGVLTLTYSDDGSKAVIAKGNWSIDNNDSYENRLYASFTYKGQTITWNRLSAMTYWSDTSLLK